MPADTSIHRLSPAELAEELKSSHPPLVVDVREPWETEIAPFPGARTIPLQELPSKASELPTACRLAMLCHHGVRSHMAARYLSELGFSEIANIMGGIDAWSRDVDPTVPRY